jgi:cation:H+ antiporter
LTVFALIAGIALLLGGGTLLIRGASGIAANAGISQMIVGLTIVAYGTSAPELVVNVVGALENETQIAFGNVIGSNIANLGLILGGTALILPIAIEGRLVRRELPLLLLGTAVLLVLVLDVPLRGERAVIDRADAVVLLLLFSTFIFMTVDQIVRARQDPLLVGAGQIGVASERGNGGRRNWAEALLGMAALAGGGHLTVQSGADLAETLGWDKVLVGMVIVAVGTSLPELVTSVVAAVRREPDLCVGNLVGSNIFNGLLVLPISALLRPIVVPAYGVTDVLASFLVAAALIPIFIIGRSQLGRPVGSLLVLAYASYIGYRFATGTA